MTRKTSLLLSLLLLIASIASPFAMLPSFAAPATAAALPLVDDFESGLPAGTDPNGVAIGFNTFKDPNAATTVAIATTTTPPAPAPGAGTHVLRWT